MPSGSVGRWPDGRLAIPLFLLCLTAGLPGLGGGFSSVRTQEDSMLRPDSSRVWLFLAPGAWETPALVPALEKAGARIRVRSEWLDAVSVSISWERIPHLLELPGIRAARPVASLPAPAIRTPRSGFPKVLPVFQDTLYGALWQAMEALDVPAANAMGFHGSGVRVGILDGFFRPDHLVLRSRPPLAMRDFVDDDGSVVPEPGNNPEAASHGTALWSLVAADLPRVLRGAAPQAGILLARVRGSGPLVTADEDRWVAGLEWLESQGARIVLSGFGFREFPDFFYTIGDLDGNTTSATLAADQAARRGVLVLAPVGNRGPSPQSLEAPADGDSVLAVGAVDSQGRPASFSARGPTADGREKPELLAPGAGLTAASAAGGEALQAVFGTEFAAALLAGAAALFVEAHPSLGPVDALEALRLSASGEAGAPVGVPRVASAIVFPGGLSAWPLQEVTGEGSLTSLAPRFQWHTPTIHPLGLPVTFHLELARDSAFQDVLVRDSVMGTFARRLQAPLPPRTRLYWRVTAQSVQGIRRATEAQGPVDVPSWVSLEVFDDPGGEQITDPQPEFRWTAVELPPPAGPFTFDLQILEDRAGEVIRTLEGLGENRYRPEEPLPFNLPLRWRVIALARTGQADTVTSAGPFVVTGEASPPLTILYQNFPNPFPDRETGTWGTRIWFDLARTSVVNLAVYDLRGRLVRRLIPAHGCGPVELPPGLYGRDEHFHSDPCVTLHWDGKGDGGREAPPGVYLLRLRADGSEEVRRVVYWP
jgi:hypothetical protein